MTPVVRILLIANIAAFFVQVMQPTFMNVFVFVPRLVVIRPWSVATYMFLHGGLMHIAFNMFALWIFGPRVEERLGTRRFTILYFLSGVTGALLSMVFSMGAAVIGASAAVFGVMMAFAHFWPTAPIYIWGIIPVPARMLVIIVTVLAIWSGFGGVGGGVAHFAHLGGFAGADLYLLWLDRSRRAFRRQATSPPKEASKRAESWRSIDMSRVHQVNQEELNRILDKIGADGIGSLTPEERLFLSNFVPMDSSPPVS